MLKNVVRHDNHVTKDFRLILHALRVQCGTNVLEGLPIVYTVYKLPIACTNSIYVAQNSLRVLVSTI